MYAFVDALFSLCGLSFFVMCLISFEPLKPAYSPIAIGWFALYPILTEGIYNFFASLCGDRVVYDISLNSRLVYSEGENLSFCGLEKFHPFDAQKYKNVFNFLLEKGVIKSEKDVIEPQKISRSLLLEKVSKLYLLKMCYSFPLSSYIEMPLFFLPSWTLRWRVLNPMLIAT